jgi:hypothetical protein
MGTEIANYAPDYDTRLTQHLKLSSSSVPVATIMKELSVVSSNRHMHGTL